MEAATANFIERGEEIAYENPDIRGEMLGAVEEVRKTGTCGESSDVSLLCVKLLAIITHSHGGKCKFLQLAVQIT